jgi:putative effector of murein hydrolase
MNRFRIAHPVSQGLALGTISHGQGTAQAATEGELTGAVAGGAAREVQIAPNPIATLPRFPA